MSLIRRSPSSPQPIGDDSFVIDVSDAAPPTKPEGLLSRMSGYTRIRKHSHTEPASMWTSWFCSVQFLLLLVCAAFGIYLVVLHYQILEDAAMTEDLVEEGHWSGVKRMFQRAFGNSGPPDHHPAVLAPPPPLNAQL
ncbi:hypothetical protein RvY_03566 [Ramazzottius varieornatus]|uniref:Uncharacterized protein n=1 Tax=Ramazzottius varieornatus TaxID=947166 RepID=A0A1D1UNI6_RAMVA|nr:hypothetical protein RvY_03566 [Ramazzottius varieornatus]